MIISLDAKKVIRQNSTRLYVKNTQPTFTIKTLNKSATCSDQLEKLTDNIIYVGQKIVFLYWSFCLLYSMLRTLAQSSVAPISNFALPSALNIALKNLFLAIQSLPALHVLQNCTNIC